MDRIVIFAIALVAVTINLGIVMFAEGKMGPHWLFTGMKELCFAFYLFSFLFYFLESRFGDAGQKLSKEQRIHEYEVSRIYHWGYTFAIPLYFLMIISYHLLPDLFGNTSSASFRLLTFGGSAAVCIALPTIGYEILRPLRKYRGEMDRLSPAKIVDIAKSNDLFERFMSENPRARIFVQDLSHRYRFARVCAAARDPLPGLQDAQRESVFEIQIDMRKKKPVEESEVFQRYLFARQEDGFSVLVLPISLADWQAGKTVEIDEVTLARLESVPTRFPDLDVYPLPIASRKSHAVELTGSEAVAVNCL